MSPEPVEDDAQVGRVLASRYRLLKRLGRGGMASVYEAEDRGAGRHVALKLLHADRLTPGSSALGHFEAEYHTLSQLAHPRVVAVHDYQKLPDAVFYTMELLAGGDLAQRSPMPYRDVCRVLCDVCSALALMHSRRLVHRDLTPRNIRLGPDGEAKLIDFGALVRFGTHKHTVGTPPFTAPEAVTVQPMDGRADLFALGATAYYALTGRLAFSARTFAGLRNVWRTVPPLPSRITPGIPPELDQLVMSLLTLAPSHRPRSASEVMERLTAIAGIELSDQLRTRSAYLATPTLAAREDALQQVRRTMVRAARGRGADVLITGEPGTGRSRMADACALEGKLAGATVLRADAQDANAGPWGGVSSLLDQLVAELGNDARTVIKPFASALANVWPGGRDFLAQDQPHEATSPGVRAEVQAALQDLFCSLSQRGFVVVAVDDADHLDEPTAAFVTLLAERARTQRMVVVATAGQDLADDNSRVVARLLRASTRLTLEPLTREQSEALLASTFGAVDNVRLLADRAHTFARGNPRALMDLMQLLLDRDIVKYQDGAWVLPEKLTSGDLPSSPSAAMEQQLSGLTEAELQLAQAMALTRMPALGLPDCQLLSGCEDSATTLTTLDGLMHARVVCPDGDGYVFTHPGWATLLTARLDAATKTTLHARVGAMFERMPYASVRAAEHRLEAGDAAGAIEAVTAQAERHRDTATRNPAWLPELVQHLPDNWLDTFEAAIAAAERLGRPRREQLDLKYSCLAMQAMTARARPELLLDLIWQMYEYAGLSRYDALAGKVPEASRLQTAFEQVKAEQAALPEAERGFDVVEAIQHVARLKVLGVGSMGGALDAGFFDRLPSLAPVLAFSPLLQVIEDNVRATTLLNEGRLHEARELQLRVLAQLETMNDSDEEGEDSSFVRYMQLAMTFSTGVIETLCGIESAMERATAIEHDGLFAVAAWHLRKLAALRRGNTDAAERCTLQIERLQIQNNPTQMFEGSEIWLDLRAWMEIGDVVRVRELAERAETMIAKFPTWTPVRHIARGRIHELRGEPEAALAEYDRALAAVVSRSPSLSMVATRGRITALAALGRFAEARTAGHALLEELEGDGGSTALPQLRYVLGLVEHLAGNHAQALQHATQVVQLPEGWHTDSVLCGASHELRARIAIATEDIGQLVTSLSRCGEIFRESRNPILIGRYERLVQEGQQAGLLHTAELDDFDDDDICTMTTAGPVLGPAATARQRAERVLSTVVEHGVGNTAFLYLLRDRTPLLTASCGDTPPPANMDDLVRHVISEELGAGSTDEIDTQDFVTSTIDAFAWANRTGDHFAPALLGHLTEDGFVITGVIVHQTEGAGFLPTPLLDQLSAALTNAGDVTPQAA